MKKTCYIREQTEKSFSRILHSDTRKDEHKQDEGKVKRA